MSPSRNRPRASVFVQAHNTARYVAECLESILNQRGDHLLEVLVIDDASTDHTAQEAARVKDARVQIVRHDRNRGAIATANEGYALAGGDFVVRIDSDDRLRPEFLQKTVPIFDERQTVGLVYTDVAIIDADGRIACPGGVVDRHGRAARGDEFFPLLLQNYIPAASTIVRRSALTPVLPVPADLSFLDWYVTTAVTETWETAYVKDVLADYRVHAQNMHRTMILDQSGEASSRRILDRLFASHVRRDEKQRWRRRVYAQHYLTYAEKYFGCDMIREARRCYWQALFRRPAALLDGAVARHFAGSLLGRRSYNALKMMILQHRKQPQ